LKFYDIRHCNYTLSLNVGVVFGTFSFYSIWRLWFKKKALANIQDFYKNVTVEENSIIQFHIIPDDYRMLLKAIRNLELSPIRYSSI
jgi:hypothetical protein